MTINEAVRKFREADEKWWVVHLKCEEALSKFGLVPDVEYDRELCQVHEEEKPLYLARYKALIGVEQAITGRNEFHGWHRTWPLGEER